MVHLLSFNRERRTETVDIVEDAFPLVDMPISVKLPAAPQSVLLAPEGNFLNYYTYADGYAHVSVTLLDGHGMLVIEQGG